ncbi:MAG: glycosyltransferase family 4 protein [Dehalococcoidia bacterium]|nr:glycosyltransferase family 4 protein [Dehalococcoidia bacterium]
MASQRRLLLVENSTGVGGSTISLFRLVSRLRNGPYRPLVLFYTENDYVSRFKELGIEVTLLRGQRQAVASSSSSACLARPRPDGVTAWARSWRRLLWKDIPEAFQIRHLIRKRGIGLVHVNGRFSSSRGAILAARLARVPCLCHLRDFHSFDRVDRWFARGVDVFLYISKAVQLHTERLLPRAKGQLVYDGVDLADFQRGIDPSNEREGWGLSKDHVVVGNMGRLVEWKGQHVFLEALSYVAGDIPRLRALVAGDSDPPGKSPYVEGLRGIVRDLGLEGRVIFTGFVTDVPRFMAALDVFVHSSIRPEPFGLTILEGMASGLPVVATAAGGPLDLLQEGETGRLVPLGDPHAMAEALRQILSDREKAARMGEAARNRVAQCFTIEKFVEDMERAYSTVLP